MKIRPIDIRRYDFSQNDDSMEWRFGKMLWAPKETCRTDALLWSASMVLPAAPGGVRHTENVRPENKVISVLWCDISP